MAEVGDKYIIEIGEVYETLDNCATANNEQVNKPTFLYRIKGFNSLVFDENGLDKLRQVNLETVQELAYQRGMNDAWEALKKIVNLDGAVQKTLFEVDNPYPSKQIADILETYTASEAIERIKAYEDEKKAEEEETGNIKVGDEVYLVDRNHPRVVTCILTENGCHTKAVQVTESGRYVIDEIRNLQKTGRHFSGIAEVLKQLQEGE